MTKPTKITKPTLLKSKLSSDELIQGCIDSPIEGFRVIAFILDKIKKDKENKATAVFIGLPYGAQGNQDLFENAIIGGASDRISKLIFKDIMDYWLGTTVNRE